MKVTLKECMALPSFSGAFVAAGKTAMDNVVKEVAVPETPGGEESDSGEERRGRLMLSSFITIKNDIKAQVKAVKTMSAEGCTGLVLFRTDRIPGGLSPKVKEKADSLRFPVIVMPSSPGPEMSDVINEIMELILCGTGEDFGNDLINNTIYHLLNFEKYNSFQSAVKAAALANDFQIILLSSDFNPIFSVETRHRTTIAEAIRLGRERSLDRQNSIYTPVDVNGVSTYWGPVEVRDEKYFMLIVDNEDSYSATDVTKLAEIIELAMGMWKYTPERDARAEFINALRRGNMSLAHSLKDEAGMESGSVISVLFVKEQEEGSAAKLVEGMNAIEGLDTIVISEDEETYGVVIRKDGTEDAKADAVKLYNEYKGRTDMTVFHITGEQDIEDAAGSFRLINEAWSFASSVFPYKSVFTKYELAMISNCINIQLQDSHVKKNYMEFFRAFDYLGENKRKQLLETLETFVLDAGTSSSKTAEYMNIHTNTVQYRLRKIDDIMGAEITGNRIIPGLTMALALRRLERVVS